MYLSSDLEFNNLSNWAEVVHGARHVWVAVLCREPPHLSLQSLQLSTVCGRHVFFVSEQPRGPNAVSLDLLPRCGLE